MKKIFLFIGFVAFGMSLNAQSDRDYKTAQKNLSKYYQNSANTELLVESIDLIESAMESDEIASEAKAWITKGKIHGELANNEFRTKTLDPSYKLQYPDAAKISFDAFAKADGMAEKKSEMRDVKSGLLEVENHLNNAAIFAYQERDYAGAFKYFKSSLEAFDLLKAKGENSRLEEDPSLLQDQYFFTAASGYYAQNLTDTKPYFEKLVEMGSDEALVYEGLYNIAKEEGDEDAVRYLSLGREKFPDDTGLLFQEINHYLTSGNLNVLIEKLDQAIEKEPNNVTVHVTLGNVYDQLAAKELADGNKAKSDEYFEKAGQKYMDGIAIDDTNYDATYSIGAMHYNKAAAMVDGLNELASDLTPAGMKNYDAKKIEMNAAFEEALPYFEKAEKLKTDDLNTIIALKEIYARLNKMEKSNEYKLKYEALTGSK